MEQEFIDKLKKLVDEQGNSALTDAKKCKSLLGNYAGSGYKKESALLLQAVEAGATKSIDEEDELEPCKMARIRDLEEDYGFSQEAAEDMVNALALVLRGDTSKTKSPLAERAVASKEAAQKAAPSYGEAKAHYKAKRYDKAIPMFKELAAAGNVNAQVQLGLCYDEGEGVPQNKAEAVKWLTMAAELGDAESQCYIGYSYRDGEGVTQDKTKAVYWYTKAAEQGDKTAQFCLGGCYDDGEGVAQDKTKAVYWYEKAAEQGDSYAQALIAHFYYKGEGVTQDKTKAVYWYTKAAEQGEAVAQCNLGQCYAKGEGVAQDKTKAAYWYTKAAEQGEEEAKAALAKLNAAPANAKPAKGGVFSGLFGKKQNKDDGFSGLWE